MFDALERHVSLVVIVATQVDLRETCRFQARHRLPRAADVFRPVGVAHDASPQIFRRAMLYAGEQVLSQQQRLPAGEDDGAKLSETMHLVDDREHVVPREPCGFPGAAFRAAPRACGGTLVGGRENEMRKHRSSVAPGG
jgi:hypothetical protein